jgi:hypothetical protein
VRDWAASMRKAAEPPKPQPSFMETMRNIDHNRRTREALDAWAPNELSAGGEGFDTDAVVVASHAYLDGWMQRNYGGDGPSRRTACGRRHSGQDGRHRARGLW